MSTDVLKRSVKALSGPISKLVNKCFQDGVFPDCLKTSIVVPLFKKGDPSVYSNYMPIALLPQVSKVVEKCMEIRLRKFCEKHCILSQKQFGFKDNYNTGMAVSAFLENVYEKLNANEFTAGIYLDLRKAFDVIDHDILLKKLENYGVRGVTLDLFSSYLRDRTQHVKLLNNVSSPKLIRSGVPQGSVMGPLLFLLYINDLVNCCKVANFYLFADDTSILYSHTDINVLITNVNRSLINVKHWLDANKVAVNAQKSVSMLFKSFSPLFKPCIDNEPLEVVESTTFLGIEIDKDLNFKRHLSKLQASISSCIGILNKLKHKFTEKTLILMYNSLFLSKLSYCCTTFGLKYKTCVYEFERLQLKSLSLSLKLSYSNVRIYMKKHNMLLFSDIVKSQACMYMHKAFNATLPAPLQRHFQQRNMHRFSKFKNNFTVRHCHSSFNHSILSVYGVKIWNALPDRIRTVNSSSRFISLLKPYLISQSKDYC